MTRSCNGLHRGRALRHCLTALLHAAAPLVDEHVVVRIVADVEALHVVVLRAVDAGLSQAEADITGRTGRAVHVDVRLQHEVGELRPGIGVRAVPVRAAALLVGIDAVRRVIRPVSPARRFPRAGIQGYGFGFVVQNEVSVFVQSAVRAVFVSDGAEHVSAFALRADRDLSALIARGVHGGISCRPACNRLPRLPSRRKARRRVPS